MAGKGQRFQIADYEEPKPLIEVFRGKLMIEFVVECLTPNIEHRFIFICQREHDEAYQLDHLFKRITKQYRKVLVDEVTEGPAASVLLAKEWIDNDEAMMTACSDDFVDISIDDFLKFASSNESAGTVMTYPGNVVSGSSAQINNEGIITKVAEKKIVGPHTTTGIYYFSKGSYFVESAEKMIQKDLRANGEFYVCPVYNEMIAQNQEIKAYQIDAESMNSMGTPEALKSFQKKLQSAPKFNS